MSNTSKVTIHVDTSGQFESAYLQMMPPPPQFIVNSLFDKDGKDDTGLLRYRDFIVHRSWTGWNLKKSISEFQEEVKFTLEACFGPDIPHDVLERGDRYLEESLEFLQSNKYPFSRINEIATHVYSKPEGAPILEAGGAMTTLSAYCNALGINLEMAAFTEVNRVYDLRDKIKAKQAAKPKGSAVPVPLSEEGLLLQLPISISSEQLKSFNLFCTECNDMDSGGFSISNEEISELIELGLIFKKSGHFQTTAFGDFVWTKLQYVNLASD